MKILALQAENIKKLVAVEIRPDGNLVQITGKNGNGKTSVLDSIWWALAGVSNIQSAPIRNGQTQARIRLDLGEIVVTRTFKQKDEGEYTSQLSVENAEGSKFPSPQAMLDGLLGQLAFDPLAFARMDSKQQFNALRRFVPDVDFEKIEADNKTDYQRRTELNRKSKEAKTLAESIIIPSGLPASRIDESSLIDQIEKAAKHNADIETRKGNRSKVRSDIEGKRNEITRIQSEIARLQTQEKALIDEATVLQKKLDSAPPLPEPIDVTDLRKKIESSKEVNKNIALREERQEHLDAAEEFDKQSKALTEAMEKREADKRARIESAKLPVSGISFGDGEILLRGVPFNQASDAEQLRASIAIAMALNPKLKVVRVRDGSLLDDDSMKILAQMADEKDYQVWIERVDGSGKVGFVLENGHLKKNIIEGDE